jgi:RNA polymerase sigma-70 factor (ECF subfamily)
MMQPEKSEPVFAVEAVLAEIYAQLRSAAHHEMARERREHTLSATALVHEAWLRLAPPRDVPFASRAQFYQAAIEAMRHVLLDHAKARGRLKRGGGRRRIDLEEPLDLSTDERLDDCLAVDEAIEALRARDPRAAEIVRLLRFAGLSVKEVAALLGVSPRTVKSDWALARAWLRRHLDTPE